MREPSASALNRRMRLIESKRAGILDAALDLFSRFGLHGTSLDQVATQADVSKTNLLYYFGSKEELYVNVLRQLLDVWLRPLRAFSAEQRFFDELAGFAARGDVVRADIERAIRRRRVRILRDDERFFRRVVD